MSNRDLALIVATDPPVAFYRGARPTDVDTTYRRLVGYSGIRSILRTETGTANSSASVTLDNGDGALSSVLGDGSLFAPATLRRDGVDIWSGVVSRLGGGPSPVINLEGGGALSYTDDFPLRTSGAWDGIDDVVALPIVYGRVIVSPAVAYPYGTNQFVIADHAIAAVDRVTLDGKALGDYRLINTTDPTGHAVALLQIGTSGISAENLRVHVRGKQDPDTGALLERPDEVFVDLHRLAGMTINPAELDDLRAYAQTSGLTIAGRIDTAGISIQSTIDAVCAGCGLAWGPHVEGLAMVWPPLDGGALGTITAKRGPDLEAQADRLDVVTRLIVAWGNDWTTTESVDTMTLVAPTAVDQYGERETTVRLSWISSEAQAQAIGERILAYRARPVWDVGVMVRFGAWAPGQIVAIDHPHSPISSGIIVDMFRTETGDGLTIRGPGGSAPAVKRV